VREAYLFLFITGFPHKRKKGKLEHVYDRTYLFFHDSIVNVFTHAPVLSLSREAVFSTSPSEREPLFPHLFVAHGWTTASPLLAGRTL